MGLTLSDPGDLCLKRGGITIIRQMRHLLPYEQRMGLQRGQRREKILQCEYLLNQ